MSKIQQIANAGASVPRIAYAMIMTLALPVLLSSQVAAPQADTENSRLAREQYSGLLSDPKRDPWQKPDQVVAALNFKSTDVVALVGDDDGYFARHIAPLVASTYLIAWDATESQHAQKEKPGGLQIVTSAQGAYPQLGMQFDTLFICNVVDRLSDLPTFFLRTLAQMKPTGRIVLIGNNPPAGLPAVNSITSTMVSTALRTLGLRPPSQPLALPFQYFLVFNY